MNKIKLVNFNDNDTNYKLIHKWCSNKFVYEWFEQRPLSYDEIVKKYKSKFLSGKQKLYLINYDNYLIGLVQIYRYESAITNNLKGFQNIFEYDIFIGDNNYLHKGIGSKVINIVNNFIYENTPADCIVLRVFKRNINAIKCYQKNNFYIIDEYNGKDTLGNDEKIIMLMNKKEVTYDKII